MYVVVSNSRCHQLFTSLFLANMSRSCAGLEDHSICIRLRCIHGFTALSCVFHLTVALLSWSLILTPLIVHAMPFTLVLQTGSSFTDLDQTVAFSSAVVVLLYQWRVKLKQWWGELRDLYERRVAWGNSGGR